MFLSKQPIDSRYNIHEDKKHIGTISHQSEKSYVKGIKNAVYNGYYLTICDNRTFLQPTDAMPSKSFTRIVRYALRGGYLRIIDLLLNKWGWWFIPDKFTNADIAEILKFPQVLGYLYVINKLPQQLIDAAISHGNINAIRTLYNHGFADFTGAVNEVLSGNHNRPLLDLLVDELELPIPFEAIAYALKSQDPENIKYLKNKQPELVIT